MRNLTIKQCFMPITRKEIELFERENNISLPIYLKDFFLIYNGAKIKESFYGNQYWLEILPLLKNNFDTSVEDFLPWIRNPEFLVGRYDLIPFAINQGAIPFLVSIGGKDEGTVYYSAVGLDENPLRKLADSFEEFINGLRSEEES
jgi:hypothetical protein